MTLDPFLIRLPAAALVAILYGFLQSDTSGYRQLTFEALKHVGLLTLGFAEFVHGNSLFDRDNFLGAHLWHLLRLNNVFEVADVTNVSASLGVAVLFIAACYAFATRHRATSDRD